MITIKYRKTNRFTGEFYQWDSLYPGAKSIESSLYLNDMTILQSEIEEFSWLLQSDQVICLSCDGQFEFKIIKT